MSIVHQYAATSLCRASNRVSSAISSLDAEQRGLSPLVIGIEGGVLWRGPELHCFAWVVAAQQAGGSVWWHKRALHVMCLLFACACICSQPALNARAGISVCAGGLLSKARSAEFMLPPAVAVLVQGGMELGDADDKASMCSRQSHLLSA